MKDYGTVQSHDDYHLSSLLSYKFLNWGLSEKATGVIVFDSLSLLNLHLGPVGTNPIVGDESQFHSPCFSASGRSKKRVMPLSPSVSEA